MSTNLERLHKDPNKEKLKNKIIYRVIHFKNNKFGLAPTYMEPCISKNTFILYPG